MRAASVTLDFLQLSSELFSGKTLPLLLAVVRLPFDRLAAVLVVTVGLLFGTFLSGWTVRATCGLGSRLVCMGNRLAQQLFSAGLSLSLFLHLSTLLAGDDGRLLALVPAFCLCAQALPERPGTACAALLGAGAAVFWGFTTALVRSDGPGEAHDVLATSGLPDSVEGRARGVWDTLSRALQLFVCAVYAGVQHAPIEGVPVSGDARAHRSVQYCSEAMTSSADYATLLFFLSNCLRLCAVLYAVHFQGNAMHVMLEGSTGWDFDKGCVIAFMAYLLYQACWTLTQARAQVMPLLPELGLHRERNRLKCIALCLAIATFPPAPNARTIFWCTNALALGSIAAACAALRSHVGYR